MTKTSVTILMTTLSACASIPAIPPLTATVAACKTIDTMATLHNLNAGGIERNPLMRFFLSGGPGTFVITQVAWIAAVQLIESRLTQAQKIAVGFVACIPAAQSATGALKGN